MSDGPDLDKLNTSLREDWRRLKQFRTRQNNDLSPALAVEMTAAAGSLLGGIAWVLAIALVPDPLSGTVWMGGGLLLLGLGVVIAGLAHVARVIGIDGLRLMIRGWLP